MLEQKKEEEEQKGPTISENKEPSTNPNEPNTAEVKASEETKPSEPVINIDNDSLVVGDVTDDEFYDDFFHDDNE